MPDPDRPTPRRGPITVLVVWAAAIALLALIGTGIERHLAPLSLAVPNTPSARADAMLTRRFGNAVPVAVLLRGPPHQVVTQGRALVSALQRAGRVQVLSPWDAMASGTALRTLRPRPGTALVLATFRRPSSEAMSVVAPTAQRVVARTIHRPVIANLTGEAIIGRAIQDATLAATHRAELIALPILVVVLLLVFRSPIAAAVPLAMGGATLVAGRGLLCLATYFTEINALGVSIASMMGLALGVDYALLMVSRIRQERARGLDHDAALAVARRAAGRTILFAGGTLALTMLAADIVAEGSLLGAVATGVVLSGLLSVALALSAMPALLALLGERIDRWQIPLRAPARRGRGLRERLIAHPAVAIPVIVAIILALAAPAGAMRMGPPDASQLPASNPARESFEAIREAISPGWSAPFVIVTTARSGPISTAPRLAALSRWQRAVAREQDVAAVFGPGSYAAGAGQLRMAQEAFSSAPARMAGAQRGIEGLRAGLARAAAAVGRIAQGLALAGGASSRLAAGAGRARRGAQRLRSGLLTARSGARRLAGGLDRAHRGAAKLAAADRRIGAGAAQLARGLGELDSAAHAALAPVDLLAGNLEALASWIGSLRDPGPAAAGYLQTALREADGMTAGRTDPRYAPLRQALASAAQALASRPPVPLLARIRQVIVRGLKRLIHLARSADGLLAAIDRLSAGARRLAAATRASERGARRLSAALGHLAAGGDSLQAGLGRLAAGSAQLEQGTATLLTGAASLARGLSDGSRLAGELTGGLIGAQRPLRGYATMLRGYRHDFGLLQSRSPAAADSGYLALTALDGTVPAIREEVAQVVNIDAGGQSARMLVVAGSAPNTAATAALSRRLQRQLPALSASSDTTVGIGQGAQMLIDYTDATTARFPWLVLALTVVAALALIAVLRALPLALIAVALNLATVAAAFGALQLLTAAHVLGGPGYLDAVSAAGIVAIMFVLSIDYEVFLLTRMRESWERRHDAGEAISHGLRNTAGVITGAAAIMTAVFLAFSAADVVSLRQFGAGLTIAVLLDATVVRLVFLPAIMRLLGARVWWIPAPLERLLPAIEHGG